MYCVSSIALKIQIFPDDENEWSEIKSCEPLIVMGPKRRLVHLKRLRNMRLKRRMSTVVDCSLGISEFSDTKPLLEVQDKIMLKLQKMIVKLLPTLTGVMNCPRRKVLMMLK